LFYSSQSCLESFVTGADEADLCKEQQAGI
jgi:hypothetical protein